jgi:hypothetical protein
MVRGMMIPSAIYGRPRGFIVWQPRAETADLIAKVRGIMDEYRQFLPLTLRQIFYRLVGVHGYEKTERAYQRLCETLNRARRARLIPFNNIRDDGFHRTGWQGWSSIEQAKCAVENEAHEYRLDRQAGQPIRLIVWCEATGMTRQLEQVCEPYSVPVFSSGGFDSVTVKYNVAREFAEMGSVRVLHIGDHDPSGVHVFGSLDEDVCAFLQEMGGKAIFVRLAVTPAQIDEYNLPTVPPKETDRRAFVGNTVQAEALPPNILAEILEHAIGEYLDMDIYWQAVDREAQERTALLEWLRNF